MTDDQDLDALFVALADPTRRRIVTVLADRQPLTTNELAALFPITRWGVMKHLGMLRLAGLVQTFPQGRRRLHFTNPGALEHAREWLALIAPSAQPLKRSTSEAQDRERRRVAGDGQGNQGDKGGQQEK